LSVDLFKKMKRSVESLRDTDLKAEDNVDAENNKKRKKVRFEKSLDNKSTGKYEKENCSYILQDIVALKIKKKFFQVKT